MIDAVAQRLNTIIIKSTEGDIEGTYAALVNATTWE